MADGIFDPEIVPAGIFDPENAAEGLFDPDQLVATAIYQPRNSVINHQNPAVT